MQVLPLLLCQKVHKTEVVEDEVEEDREDNREEAEETAEVVVVEAEDSVKKAVEEEA